MWNYDLLFSFSFTTTAVLHYTIGYNSDNLEDIEQIS